MWQKPGIIYLYLYIHVPVLIGLVLLNKDNQSTSRERKKPEVGAVAMGTKLGAGRIGRQIAEEMIEMQRYKMLAYICKCVLAKVSFVVSMLCHL